MIMISIKDKQTEDVDMKTIDGDNVSPSGHVEQQVDDINVKDFIAIEPSKQAFTHDVDMSDSINDQRLNSSTTKHIQISPNNINMTNSPDSKTSPSKETMLSISQADLDALHDKISAQKESIANLNLSLTTSRAKISSQEVTISAFCLPLPANPNGEIAKLKTENTRLNDENMDLSTQIKALETKKQQIIDGAKEHFQKLDSEISRRGNELTRRHAIIVVGNATLIDRNNALFAAENKIRGLQKQLDSVYITFQRQSNQIASQQRQHVRKLARITAFFKDGVKNARKRALLQSKRDTADLVELMNFSYASEEEEEEESSEDEDEENVRATTGQEVAVKDEVAAEEAAEGGGEMMEIVDLVDDDEEEAVAGGEKPVGQEQLTADEREIVREKSVVREQSFAHDKPNTDKLDIDKPVLGEPTPPRKRVRLSMERA